MGERRVRPSAHNNEAGSGAKESSDQWTVVEIYLRATLGAVVCDDVSYLLYLGRSGVCFPALAQRAERQIRCCVRLKSQVK